MYIKRTDNPSTWAIWKIDEYGWTLVAHREDDQYIIWSEKEPWIVIERWKWDPRAFPGGDIIKWNILTDEEAFVHLI